MPPEALENDPKYDTSLDVFSYGGITLYTVNGICPKPTAPTKFDPMTRQIKGISEVDHRQEHLDKMTGETMVLRPLVETCLDNNPVKRPSIREFLEKIKLLKVCVYVIVTAYICVSREILLPYVGPNHIHMYITKYMFGTSALDSILPQVH